MPPPPSRGRLQLPAELVLMIASHLDGLSTTFLALTCRDLYSLLTPDRITLDTAERTQVLLWVERQIPHLYFCHTCVKLHRWRGSWTASLFSQVEAHLHERWEDRYDILTFSPTFAPIAYPHARLIMNRHLWGEKHGPLPSILRQAPSTDPCWYFDGVKITSARPFFDDIKITTARDARIVDGQLLVKTTMTLCLRRPGNDDKTLRKSIPGDFDTLCWHMNIDGKQFSWHTQVPELAAEGDAEGLFLPCEQTVRSCPFCMTDYSISITPESSKKKEGEGQVVEIVAYRQLGTCRSPLDWSWLTLSKPGMDERFRIELDESYYGPGTIRNRWHGDEDVADIVEARWVEMYEELARSSRYRDWQRSRDGWYFRERGEVAMLY